MSLGNLDLVRSRSARGRRRGAQTRSIAVLTSGGDAPGMNAAIRAVVRYGITGGLQVSGILRGYAGLLEGQIVPLQASSVANIIQRGGTMLKTARCEAFFERTSRAKAAKILRDRGIDALVVVGGDGSFTGAALLERETGFRTVGVPGTIDNDIPGTDATIGFDTAINTAIDAIDRIRDTASSHDRIFLVEVMGRSSGHIAAWVGVGGGAETILVPENKRSVREIARSIERGVKRGKSSSIIVVAEGDEPGRSQKIAHELEQVGYAGAKVCILGHTQRGGIPSAQDRVLASVLGAQAVEVLLGGRSGLMVGTQKGHLSLTPYNILLKAHRRLLKPGLVELAEALAT